MTSLNKTELFRTIHNSRQAENTIRDQFKATSATIDNESDRTILRLEFYGFTALSPALAKVTTVAHRIDELDSVCSLNCGVNTDGGYRPDVDERDDRPRGWVNAEFPSDLKASPPTCTCDEKDACDNHEN